MNTHKQQGLSLVELMVALAVSSFLILGITQVYINNKRNYVFQQSQASNLDSSRFAVMMLDEILTKAGYRRAPDQSMESAFPASHNLLDNQCSNFTEGAVIAPLKADDAIGFCLRYQPALDGETLCDGASAELGNQETFIYPKTDETIYLAIEYKPHDSEQGGTISCLSNKGREEGNSAAELLDGIADMQVEFASGFEMEKRLKANPYKNATEWESTNGMIRAIRYSVLTTSRPNQRDGDSLVLTQWLANTATSDANTRLSARDKGQLYQAAVGSQAIRNMMP